MKGRKIYVVSFVITVIFIISTFLSSCVPNRGNGGTKTPDNSKTNNDTINKIEVRHNASNTSASYVNTYMVPMSDGIRLATDLYLPNKNTGVKVPIDLYRTPYNKNLDKYHLLETAIENNIGVVVQDQRGCDESEGEFEAFGLDGKDAYDTVQWMKKQTWFNGKYATYGNSARGITQYQQVPYLNDISMQAIEVASPDLFNQGLFQGGVPRKMLLIIYTLLEKVS